jgi:sugar phosphate isomerase/epimerase
MKIALRLQMTPVDTMRDKAKWAADHGADGVEMGCMAHDRMRQVADEINGIIAITSVCANATPDGRKVFNFLHPDKALRRESIEASKAILKFCGDVGAVGQIVPPIFGPAVVPDLSPVMSVFELEEQLMIATLKEVGPYAAEHKTLFLVEPLNRYEQHYLRTQADGVRVLEKAAAPGTGLLTDFFHMHIEETDTPAAIRAAGRHVAHVHLADNTRMEPGSGDIDFVAGFKALRDIGFDGVMAFECDFTGDSNEKKLANLARSIQHVRDCWQQSAR